MPDKNVVFFSFPKSYSADEKALIKDAFRLENTEIIEKKGYGEFMDLILALPDTIVITIRPGALATGIFEKLHGERSGAVIKKLMQGVSVRSRAKLLFQIPFGPNELKVEIDIKMREQLDYFLTHILELIPPYQNAALNKEVKANSYWLISGNQWKEIRADQYNSYAFPVVEKDTNEQLKQLRQAAIQNNPYTIAFIKKSDEAEYQKMLELREKVYIGELKWIDKENPFYDNKYAEYIIVYDEQKNQVGSLRILRPESPWMIEKEFKELLDGYEIHKEGAIEITRLLISTEKRHLKDSMQASVCLFRGIYQWLRANKFASLYMVVRPEYFKFFQVEGLCPERIGVDVEGFDGVAGRIDMETTMSYLKEHLHDLWVWLTADDAKTN